jgi:hypothetical protein
MVDTLDPDVAALKEWLKGAWCRLADPTLTRFEQREIRNYMKDAEQALRAGLKQVANRDLVKHQTAVDDQARKRPNFRLLMIKT